MSVAPHDGARLTLLDALEGMYVAAVLDFLHREGVLAALGAGEDVVPLAERLGFEAGALVKLLEYAALRSDLVERIDDPRGARFTASAAYRESGTAAYLLDQYAGAFGPCLLNLQEVMRAPAEAGRFVDRARHADAYRRASTGSNAPELVALAGELGINVLLDVGCGGGQLLAALAESSPAFRGIGIDANPAAVDAARQLLAARGLDGRVEVVCGDLAELGVLLSEERRASVDALAAVSVANAYAAGYRGRSIDDFLRALQVLFPNRFLFLFDYHGRLGTVGDEPVRFRRTLLHDLAQVVSGEGVPPANLDAWREIYRRTGCTLVAHAEGEHDGIARFLHLVQL